MFNLLFKARKSNLKSREGKTLWFPELVKYKKAVTTDTLAERIAEKSSLTPGDVLNVVNCLFGEMKESIMNGYPVNLKGLGTLSAVIKAGGNGVENPEEVSAAQVKTMRIQFTPAYKRTPMEGVTRSMFQGVTFERWIGDPYHPVNLAKNGGNTEQPGTNPGEGGGGEGWQDPTA